MPERKFEVRPVGVEYVCGRCGDGVMVAGKLTLGADDEPAWMHTCPSCGHSQPLPEKYPTVRFERVEPTP